MFHSKRKMYIPDKSKPVSEATTSYEASLRMPIAPKGLNRGKTGSKTSEAGCAKPKNALKKIIPISPDVALDLISKQSNCFVKIERLGSEHEEWLRYQNQRGSQEDNSVKSNTENPSISDAVLSDDLALTIAGRSSTNSVGNQAENEHFKSGGLDGFGGAKSVEFVTYNEVSSVGDFIVNSYV